MALHHRYPSIISALIFIARIFFIGDFIILPVLATTSFLIHSNRSSVLMRPDAGPQPEFRPGEVVIRTRTNQPPIVGATSETITFPDVDELEIPTTFARVRLPTELSVNDAIDLLKDDPNIISVEPNLVRRITAMPNDPELLLQWHLTHSTGGIHAPEAWNTQTGNKNTIVAVIDTGVDLDHPDLVDNIWKNQNEIPDNSIDDDGNGFVDDIAGYDFVDDDGTPNPTADGKDDDNYAGADTGTTHGTHVAGIIGAVGDNNVGISGVSWHVSIMAIRVLDDEGAGVDSDIADGIRYAADNGANIINMSFGGFGSTNVLEEAIRYATQKGSLVIAAAGNNGVNVDLFPFYPVCYDNVLGVASTSEESAASSFSNFGEGCVDVSAPGEVIYSTLYTNDPKNNFSDDYGYMSGTSMATPVVVGSVALLKSQNSALTRQELFEIIVSNSEDIGLSLDYGNGRVNPAQSILRLDITGLPSVPTTIRSYNSRLQKIRYRKNERSRDRTPYFTWNAGEDSDGISGYYVYMGTNATADPLEKGTFSVKRTLHPTLPKQSNEVTYYLRIRAEDTLGHQSLDVASFIYILDTVTRPPQNVHTVKNDDALRVQWEKRRTEHVTSYVVRREIAKKNTQPSSKQSRKMAIVPHPTESWIDTTVHNETQYRYRVIARDDLGNIAYAKKTSFATFFPRERVVIAAGRGEEPSVAIYNTDSEIFEHTWRAFPSSMRGGINVTVGNVDTDRNDEIIVAPKSDNEPRVLVMNEEGETLKSFLAYPQTFTGGVSVATADVNGDGIDEIITSSGEGMRSTVKIFTENGKELFHELTPFDEHFFGGADVTGLDWDGDGTDEIAVAAGAGGGPQILIFSARTETQMASFFAYGNTMHTGVRLARVDSNGDEYDELLTIPINGTTHVKHFARGKNGEAELLNPGFFAFDQNTTGDVAAGDLTQENRDMFLVSGGNNFRVFDKNGNVARDISQALGDVTIGSITSGWLEASMP